MRPQRGIGREGDLFVGARVERVDVVVGMAHRVLVKVVPGEHAVNTQEEGVEPLGPEHGAVAELVAAVKEVRGDSAVREKRQRETGPHLAIEEVIGYSSHVVHTQPELSRMAEFRLDWIAQVYFRNLALLVLFAGGLHLRLYTFRGQGSDYKFNLNWLGEKNPTFLWGNQLRDNVFWSVASGCTVWTAYEVPMMWAYANGMIPYVDWETRPVYCSLLLCELALWQEVHFYFTHRLLHWRPLYRSAHHIHHKNVSIGPWSGLALHPIEHIIYFSGVLIFLTRISQVNFGVDPLNADSMFGVIGLDDVGGGSDVEPGG